MPARPAAAHLIQINAAGVRLAPGPPVRLPWRDRDLHVARPGMWLLGSEGVAEEWLARDMPPGAAQRTRYFVAHRAPLALYGMEAMAHLTCVGATKDELEYLYEGTPGGMKVLPSFAVVPAHGLTLEEVGYPAPADLAEQANR